MEHKTVSFELNGMLIHTIQSARDSEYRKMLTEESHIKDYLLQTPPVYTMPEKLFKSILNRAGLESKKKTEAISVFHKLRKHFLQQSVSNYIDRLISMHATDRATTVEMLRERIV